MDNITHTLTGALAAKLVEGKALPVDDEKRQRRTLFWVLVICANLPDIDVPLNFLVDSTFSIIHHRGITHSVLFAPIFALLPAFLFFQFSKLRNFKALWLTATIGILLHIFFDLITGFGTQIFSPIIPTRYSLDWMFIIDPFFTGILLLTLLLGKTLPKQKRLFVQGGGILVAAYIGVEIVSHSIALGKIDEAVRSEKVTPLRVSALPQPLSIFRWMGLVQTEDGVMQTFFSVLQSDGPLHFKNYRNTKDQYVDAALKQAETGWYMGFARFPWTQSKEKDGRHIVEFRDLQFSIDESLLKSVGMAERKVPFVLRYEFSPEGKLLGLSFNDKAVLQQTQL
jgi:membrane-bound metal-dependent hydrolase YbcI (DUF457 family)